MPDRTFWIGVLLILLPVPSVADDGVLFTTLRCGNATPPDVVIYNIEGRYPTVTELLDLADGKVQQIEVRLPVSDPEATRATVEFLLLHGLGTETPHGDCDSPQECKTKIGSLCSTSQTLCSGEQPSTGVDAETGAKTCTGNCCNKESGILETRYKVYCFKVVY